MKNLKKYFLGPGHLKMNSFVEKAIVTPSDNCKPMGNTLNKWFWKQILFPLWLFTH